MALIAIKLSAAIQFKVKIEHDMSKPTFGLLAPTSSKLTYSSRKGLQLEGTVQEILGPPVKVARGVNNILRGTGAINDNGAAILGIDTRRLEAAGADRLISDGLLRSASHPSIVDIVQDLPGREVSNIVEVPVKVPSLRHSLGRSNNGEALRREGIKEVFEGASEGVRNIGNIMSRASSDASTAFRLLPMIIDMQREDYEQEQAQKSKRRQYQN